MPLYEHGPSKERKRTVPGSYEDVRVSEHPDWTLIPREDAPADEPAAPQQRRGARTTD